MLDQALAGVSAIRADLGAIQNRFQSTIANLSSVSENVSAARSRIQDADFAAETANLTRNQIIQQATFTVPPGMKLEEIMRIGQEDNEPRCLVEAVRRVVDREVQLHFHRVVACR